MRLKNSTPGAPAEFDPLGGNVGLSSPYYTINSEPPPEPLIPTLYPMDDTSPTYVNGQRVTATLDGMPISLGHAMSMLQNGSAIPAALASYMSDPRFRFENVGSGIFRAFIPGRNDAPPPSNAPADGRAYGTLDRWVSFFMPISWGAQDTYARLPARRLAGEEVTILRNSIQKNINADCKTFIKNLIEQVAKDVGSTAVSTEMV